jgi:hypothetical protein
MDFIGLVEQINSDLLNGISTIMRYVLPLSFTIYFFVYKEKKDIAYSLLKKSFSFSLLLYLVCSLILILIPYKQYLFLIDFKYSPLLFFSLWLFSVYKIYIRLLNSINIKYVFKNNMKKIVKTIDKVEISFNYLHNSLPLNKGDEIIRRYKIHKRNSISTSFSTISNLVESNFQILFSKIKYNLPIDFSNNNQELSSVLVNMNDRITDLFNNNNFYYRKFRFEYFYLYKLILKEHVSVVSQCLTLGSSKDLNDVLKNLTNLIPPINSLYSKEFFLEFYKTVFDALYLLSDRQYHAAVSILRNMNALEKDSEEIYRQEDILALFYCYLIVAIEKNNVKLLTDIANIAFKMQERNNRKNKPVFKISSAFNLDKIAEKLKDDNENDKNLINILILCMVKAMELGHYSCVGYLIKVCIQNFSNRDLNEAFLQLRNQEKEFVLSSERNVLKVNKDIVREINVDFNFSTVSYFYCLEKVSTIIYLQQTFLKEIGNTKNIKEFEIINIRKIVLSEAKFNYFKLKIKGLNKEYGLICLREVENFEDIKYPNQYNQLHKYKRSKAP